MKRLVTAALTTLALTAISAPAAQAARQPTGPERNAIATTTTIPPQCQRALVSTVDERWAYAATTNTDGCPQGDGYFLLFREGTGFREVRQASFENPPCSLQASPPSQVGLDLKLCRRPKTFLGCSNSDLTFVESRYKPRRCLLLAFRGTGFPLRSMRWRSWGGKTAYGKGLTGGSRIKVKLYRRVKVQGDYCYTRMRYRIKGGGGPFRFPKCGTDVS